MQQQTPHRFLSRHHHPLLSLLSSPANIKSLSQIKQTHALLITSGLAVHPYPPSKLLDILLSLPSIPTTISFPYAHHLLLHSPHPSLFSLNSLLRLLPPPSSLALFCSSLRRHPSLLPNRYTFSFVLTKCCDGGLSLVEGEEVRAQVVKRGCEGNVFVSNVLVKMYGSKGLVDEAKRVFDEMGEKDLYSWNLLLSVYVGNGDVGRAREVFDGMKERDVVSWSTMIAGYVQVGCFMEAVELFREMQLSDAAPNEFTLTAVLAACANLVALDQGRWIHASIDKAKIKMNDRLVAGLIDMYAKCGELGSALEVFNAESRLHPSVRPWNAMLSGFAVHGHSEEAIELFERMKAADIAPNKVTFVSLLSACSHARFVEKGRTYFESMRSIYGIDPEMEHYGCMVDLHGRAGLLKEAEEFILMMPMVPDTVIWSALLSASRIHGDVERGKRIGKIIGDLEPRQVGCQVLMANIYSSSGRWTDAKDLRKNIEATGVSKVPGCSAIELNGMFHQFLVGDRSHPQTNQIYSFLDEMAVKLKIAGYVPEIGEVLLDVDDEDKETALSRHSEKLAIAFGLINTAPGTTIRIVKNLRVCRDCHHVTKFISKVYDREIIVRDRIRFHHFKDGLCSCKDYW